MVEEEDHQPLTQPIIEPPRDKFSMIYSKDIPRTFYSDEYMVQTMSKPQLLRNVSILGALHHGKTILSDMLIQSTYLDPPKISNTYQDPKYTDSRLDEMERGISVKASAF